MLCYDDSCHGLPYPFIDVGAKQHWIDEHDSKTENFDCEVGQKKYVAEILLLSY
jgi:hypothetical protein